MRQLLLCLLFLCQQHGIFSHVSLTFPPARTYIFDYYDNARFYRRGPCGMSKTDGAPKTTLITGSTINVTWHLSYPHDGGAKLELIRERGGGQFDVVQDLTNGFRFREDTVRQNVQVTLPTAECRDCAIRLIRQGTEYYSSYAFWSCADVSIVNCNEVTTMPPPPMLSPLVEWIRGLLVNLAPSNGRPGNSAAYNNLLQYVRRNNIVLNPPTTPTPTCAANQPGGCYDGYCMNGGTCNMATGQCQCHRLFAGDRCQYKDECWTSEDCSYNGECIDTRATAYPILKCYCVKGYFGAACDRVSQITEIRSDYATNQNYLGRELLSRQVFMYWRYVNSNTEIEVVMRVKTHSWVGVGWKSTTTTSTCKVLEPVLEVEAKHAEAQRLLLQKQASYKTDAPNPTRDPEIDVENRLGSNIEEKCASKSGRKKRSTETKQRVRRQSRVYRGMDCADITIGSVKGNLSRVQDMWTPDCSVPMPDAYFGGTDDITSAYGTQENGFTTIAFRKKLQVNHFSDHAANNGPQLLIWARGQDVNNYAHSPPTGLENCRASDFRFYRHDELKYHGGTFTQQQKGRLTHTFRRPIPPATTTATTRAAAGPLNNNAGSMSAACSNSGEFRTPSDCSSANQTFNCDFFVRWELTNGDQIVFTMKATQSSPSRYLALGISDDTLMPMTDIYYAYLSNGQLMVVDSYARTRSRPSRDTKQNVTPIAGSFINNVMTIKFSRPRTSSDTSDLGFDQCRYFLYAQGLVLQGRLTYHGRGTRLRGSSSQRICIEACNGNSPENAEQNTTPAPTTSPTVTTAASINTDTCTTSSGELKYPSTCNSINTAAFNCDFYIRWRLKNGIIRFTLKATQTSQNTYVALGISNDQRMARTDVYSGFLNSSQPVIRDRYANGYSRPRVDNEQDVTPISGQYNNGVLTIEFSRPRTSSSPFDIGFSECRYLLYAKGPVVNGNINYHTFRRASQNKICITPCNSQ